MAAAGARQPRPHLRWWRALAAPWSAWRESKIAAPEIATKTRLSDRISIFLLRVARVALILIFIADFVGEIVDGDPQILPRWYIYVGMYTLTLWLSLRSYSAQPLIVGASGFLAAALIVEWLYGVEVGSADSVTSIAVIAILGMLSVALHPERRSLRLIVFSVVIAVTAYASAELDGLPVNDAVVRTVASPFVLLLGGWVLGSMRDELEALIASKDAFIASVSHELRTPLTGVVGFASMLEEQVEEADDETVEIVGYISSQSRDVADLVEDLLVAARADTGTLSVRPQPVQICGEVADIVNSTRIQALSADKHLTVSGAAPGALADPLRVRQILRNLIGNALRYGGDAVEVTVGSRDGRVFVEVADDGQGLAHDEAELVFEPYYRARQAVSQPGSVGLGLAVSRQLARMMHGNVETFRRDGHTIFRLDLPAAPATSSSEPAALLPPISA